MWGVRTPLRCVLMYVVAKAANDKRQLASQAARQIIKHTLSSELEGVLHYMPVACRRLPFIVFAFARYHSILIFYTLQKEMYYCTKHISSYKQVIF